ncbi:MAG TPA: hypothetical protein VN761_06280 [Candidatus Polarisedimenticolia bacterium]|nr:hypothetical protein [Candidatus Polarisedimenticolia bacterium]
MMALRGGGPIIEEATIPCKEANEALTYAIAGILCAVIIEPLAIMKALQAKKMIAHNPRLSGSGKANAALIIGIAMLGLAILGLLSSALEQSGR